MYFRQLNGRISRKEYYVIIWKNVITEDDLSYNGKDVSDAYGDWDWFTNGNKLSFKLALIY